MSEKLQRRARCPALRQAGCPPLRLSATWAAAYLTNSPSTPRNPLSNRGTIAGNNPGLAGLAGVSSVEAAAIMLQQENLELGFAMERPDARDLKAPLAEQLQSFSEFGKATQVIETEAATFAGAALSVPTYVNEFWTSKQRAASSLHEVSYRACFKPQLPRLFIERLTEPGQTVYDPFMGRGTTVIEAALLGRVPFGCDVNPLSAVLARPRLHPPSLKAINERLGQVDYADTGELPEDLLVFYHPDTLKEICALRRYLIRRSETGASDHVDDWIRMVAVNRLTGHSPGFFSVYTLPPNQAVSVKSQRRSMRRAASNRPAAT